MYAFPATPYSPPLTLTPFSARDTGRCSLREAYIGESEAVELAVALRNSSLTCLS